MHDAQVSLERSVSSQDFQNVKETALSCPPRTYVRYVYTITCDFLGNPALIDE
jgi:hypothetical protein